MTGIETIRTFIALETPASLKQEIRVIQERLRNISGARVTWVRAEGIHLTLKFLGDVEETKIPELTECVGECARALTRFEIMTTIHGGFPNLRRPKVLWVGVDGGQRLLQLQCDIERSLEALGFPLERKKFHPHITVGRVRSININSSLSEQYKGITFQRTIWEAVDIRVISSTLKPDGAVYKVMAALKFATD